VQQQRYIIEAWIDKRDQLVAELHQGVDKSPEPIVDEILEKLRSFGHGIAYLIEADEGLELALLEEGYWDLDGT
jgi:hypothetical protein